MGLDMYLYKDTYIGANYEHRNVQGVINLTSGIDNDEVHINFNRVVSIREQVAYWRKANHIHKWFVDNVQDGNDDCGTHFVSRDALVKLYRICREVILKPSDAEKLLPTEDGFFFGSTDYDDYYMSDVTYTADMIDSLLAEGEDDEFYYHASW